MIATDWVGTSRAASPDQAPPVPPGLGRVWFIRQLIPGTNFYAPVIYANGATVSYSAQGTAFYRDFTPGDYLFTIENCLPQQGTSVSFTIAPGAAAALEVQQNDNASWDCSPPSIFYLRLPPAEAIASLFAGVRYLGAR
jgi:hypothetical protein